MSAYTSGPWVAIPGKIRWHGRAPIFENGLWHILPANDLARIPICSVDHADDHHPLTREKAEADARLIAASPLLLAALKEAVKDASSAANPSARLPNYEQCVAAIKEATDAA